MSFFTVDDQFKFSYSIEVPQEYFNEPYVPFKTTEQDLYNLINILNNIEYKSSVS